MAGLGDLFGSGSAVEQLFVWGVLNQVISALAGPGFTALAQDINEKFPEIELSPDSLAQMVIRNYMPAGEAATRAARSGVSADRFRRLVDIAGNAPAPGDLATALRRGLIPESGIGPDAVSFDAGIREGRLADKWSPMMRHLAVQWPTPTDALDALLEGQISHGEALALYEKLGGDPQFFQVLFNTRGSAPTPLEASEMADRGIIPWEGTGPEATTYQQAFLEGPWRNKWSGAYRELARYLPPQSTVVTLLAHGALTHQQAAGLLAKQGMDHETIAAYLAQADTEALSDYRGLATSAVESMYFAQLINETDAKSILESLHVTGRAADLMLAYADLKRAITAVTRAVSRVGSLYAARKVTRETAVKALVSLKVPESTVQDIIGTWDIENSINVKLLTESQIINAWSEDIMTIEEAMTELTNIGYTPYDAWVLLSIKNKGPLPGRPSPGPAPPQGAVIPGTT